MHATGIIALTFALGFGMPTSRDGEFPVEFLREIKAEYGKKLRKASRKYNLARAEHTFAVYLGDWFQAGLVNNFLKPKREEFHKWVDFHRRCEQMIQRELLREARKKRPRL